MAARITDISFTRAIVEADGTLTTQSREFFRTITDRALIIGTGSPEGVVPAVQGADYMDEAGVTGSIRWSKRDANVLGDDKLGWIAN